ncbi:hypothetical protein AAKU55_005519 [Oxalobacteraceae bacterium GrIS 1.11]
MKTSEQLRAAVRFETAELLAYRASHPMRQVVAFLDALSDSTLADLATVAPDRLQYTQGALAQLQAIRRTLCSDSAHVSPLV